MVVVGRCWLLFMLYHVVAVAVAVVVATIAVVVAVVAAVVVGIIAVAAVVIVVFVVAAAAVVVASNFPVVWFANPLIVQQNYGRPRSTLLLASILGRHSRVWVFGEMMASRSLPTIKVAFVANSKIIGTIFPSTVQPNSNLCQLQPMTAINLMDQGNRTTPSYVAFTETEPCC